IIGLEPEPEPEVPTPHDIQKEALEALERTRQEGNSAGLVVLATGLGKTWLSAFDSDRPEYAKVLFVAHREEILEQARKTFRRIRPRARLGLYNGQRKDGGADVLFASIQTLGKERHLEAFRPDEFDYIIVDEFHHAAARTYRRLIDYFDPRFLLGLTATPERTDGGDLLALCQENLVFDCDFVEGIRRGLLCPFRYLGVPDEVDYRNIPWRSSRFDEEALTTAVATVTRAENALEQYRQHGGQRTLGFCCSIRHAKFMADFFNDHDIKAAAVHSDPDSDPRTASLEKLEKGELQVVFAVDLFNEGVDLPQVDTVLMLRPTESSIVWTQQFGRGLRTAEGKKRLNVIDYIGNHRIFLVKIRALLEPLLGQLRGDAQIAHALETVSAGGLDLPPECSVTYDLVSVDVIGSMLRPAEKDAVVMAYRDLRDRMGQRPTAVELYHEGYNPRALKKGYGSWFGFVQTMGDLDAREVAVLRETSDFLADLEVTPMTKSYKMLVLLAMLNRDAFPGEIGIDDLTREFRRLAERSAQLRADVGDPIETDRKLRGHIEGNPINAWVGGRGTHHRWFEYAEGVFRTTFNLAGEERTVLQTMVRELVEWRLAEYLDRNKSAPGAGGFLAHVRHAGGRPIIFLPDRSRHEGVPFGETPLLVDGTEYEGRFVKVALNVVTAPGSDRNVLPQLLRTWFGPDAGLPGTNHTVGFSPTGAGWEMMPAREQRDRQLELWKAYSREEIPGFFGLEFNQGKWNSGFITIPGHIFLLVTLEKDNMQADHRYTDHFESRDTFIWQSQNQTKQDSKHGRMLKNHRQTGDTVHLFVRKTKKRGNRAAPFVYCGPVDFESWEGEQPTTVMWRLGESVPQRLESRFGM
ncbi:MAG: DUF3427 domain-containing protein, partial [Acidobacteriota bacterium]